MNLPLVTDPSPEEVLLPNAADKPVDQNQTTEKSNGGSKRCFALTLAIVMIVLIVTMPALFYPGDNFVTRAECAHLLSTGELGIPVSRKAELGDFVAHRGQYFFENDARGRLFPKYGVAYTLLYLPPMLCEQAIAGQLKLIHDTGTLLILLNLYNLLFAAIIIAYLWQLVSLYTDRAWLAAAFVLASVFGTFLWFYLRAFSHDIFQIAAFLGFAYHTLVFLRSRRLGERSAWVSLLVACLCLGVLIHMRFSYALLYLPLWAACFAAGPDRVGLVQRLHTNWSHHRWKYAATLAVPSALMIGLLLFSQWWKFGSAFDHGYGQWRNVSVLHGVVNWRFLQVLKTVNLYFIAPGNGNVFLHFPLIGFAMFGVWRFWRKQRLDSLFILGVLTCVLIPVLRAKTEGYGYGPRYLLPALLLCSLPVVEVCECVLRWRRPIARFAVAGLIFLVLAWSCRMQIYMNSLPFFAYYYVAKVYVDQVKGTAWEEAMKTYFNPVHRGYIHRDLIAYRRGDNEFSPVKILLDARLEGTEEQASEMRNYLLRASAPNLLFFASLAPKSVQNNGSNRSP